MRTFPSVLLILALGGCDPAGTPEPRPAPAPAPAASVAPGPSAATATHIPEEERTPSVIQAEAQAYLDRTREAAELRHRQALAQCESGPADMRDACIQSAEEGLLAEIRAARVEFDARMSRAE